VNYSQCLGVIGYSLLPLTVIATILPVLHSNHIISFCFKVLLMVLNYLWFFFANTREKGKFSISTGGGFIGFD